MILLCNKLFKQYFLKKIIQNIWKVQSLINVLLFQNSNKKVKSVFKKKDNYQLPLCLSENLNYKFNYNPK